MTAHSSNQRGGLTERHPNNMHQLVVGAVSTFCIALVLIFNVYEMMALDDNAKLSAWSSSALETAIAIDPVDRPISFEVPTEVSPVPRPISKRKEGIQTDFVKAGDYIYYRDRQNWDAAPIVVEKYKLIFFTVPKVGCTVWKQLFRRMMGYSDWLSQDGDKGLPHNPSTNRLKYLYHYSVKKASVMMTSPEWNRVMMVRDPKQRFLSSFLDKAVSNDHIYIFQRCCHPSVTLNTTLCEGASYSAEGFLNLASVCNDPHWAPQHERIDYKYWPYIDHLLHVESAGTDAKVLLQKLGSFENDQQEWISAWDRYGKSGWGKNNNGSIFASQSAESAGIHATWAHEKHWQWLTPDIENKVEQFYRSDYENPLFNFTRGKCLTCINT
jgi:hypothetical protein